MVFQHSLQILFVCNIFQYKDKFQMTDTYPQKEFYQLRKHIYKHLEQSILPQQDLILQQNNLLQQCKKKLQRRRTFETLNSFSLNITNISSINNITPTEDSFRNRFAQEFQNSILNAAIKQVKLNCTYQTFDTIITYILNNKTKEYDDLKSQYEKKVRQCEKLSILIIIKHKDITFLERDLSNLKTKEVFLQEERRKLKKKMQAMDQKQQRLHNIQMSLIFKEKLNLQGKRRYERQKIFKDEVLIRIQKVYQELNEMWDNISINMQKFKCNCQVDCWKAEFMKKCRQQLLQHRKILQDQERQIQSEYDNMCALSEQIKRVIATAQPQLNKKSD